MRLSIASLSALFLLTTLHAQTPAQLKQELRTRESAAKQDPDALYQVGKWAEDHGLAAESKRIYQNVLKIKADHEGANKALGNELFEGKWVTAKDAAAARKKALDAEYKAKGMVEVAGVWVDKDHVADAKRGIFHFENDLVTKEEMAALGTGMVRHPVTGQIIEAKHLEDAKARKFPIGTEGRWADEKDADSFHADIQKPWIVRTAYCNLVGTLPIAKLEQMKALADRAVERARVLMNSQMPSPANRPTVVVAATDDEFTTYGRQIGDETSAFGAFLAAEQARMRLEYQGEVRPAVCNAKDENWAPYYLRHAAGLAYANGLGADSGAELPLWFVHAFGGYASRFDDDNAATSFGEQHIAKGGVKDLKGWFNSFALNGEMEPKQLDFNVFQAGLLLAFVVQGGDAKVTEAMQEVAASVAGGKSKTVDKAVEKLRAMLTGKEDALRDFLQKVVKKR